MSHSLLFASFLILIGASMIVGALFNIHVPIFKLFFAGVLIYLGISILIGTPLKKKISINWPEDEQSHAVVFSHRSIDLSKVDLATEDELELVTVFGTTAIQLSRSTPVKIVTKSVFGSSQLPDRSNNGIAIGKDVFTSPSYEKGKPHLDLDLVVVFGAITITYID